MSSSVDQDIASKLEIFDYSLVDTSKDALKFKAAASFQLPSSHTTDCNHAKNESSEELLVVSPYTTRPHLLDLRTVNNPCQLLALALTKMVPTREDYATAAYA